MLAEANGVLVAILAKEFLERMDTLSLSPSQVWSGNGWDEGRALAGRQC